MNMAMSVVEHWPVILGLGFCPQYCEKQGRTGRRWGEKEEERMLMEERGWKEKDIVIDNTLTKQKQRSNKEPDYYD